MAYAVWLVWAAFTAYSLHVARRESFARSVRAIWALHWGRQVGIDLYIGFTLALGLIYLNGGGWALLAWLVPVYVFGNLAVLLYVALHLQQILAHFPSG